MSLTRRQFLHQTAAASSLAAAIPAGPMSMAGAATISGATRRPLTQRPNIIYIIVEDCGPNYSCYD